MRVNFDQLKSVEAPGKDPCSQDTMEVMSQVGSTALDKCRAYIARLTTVAEKLHESAQVYGMTELHNTATFRQAPQ